MAITGEADTGGARARFPTTHWSQLRAVAGGELTDAHKEVLNVLIRRYWKPAYAYLRRKGCPVEDAKDLVQEFFTNWLHKGLFGRADPARGRFRNFFLASLDNFLANAHRAAHARCRRPPEGLVSIDNLSSDEGGCPEPADRETPEAVFLREWVSTLLLTVLHRLEEECRATGKEGHFLIFKRRIIEPVLEGRNEPPMAALAQELGLQEKQASNCLLTARRAYQRLLREEIRIYAASDEEVAAEMRDLFDVLSASTRNYGDVS